MDCVFPILQGHSVRNFIDPSLQDNVIIQSGFFQYIFYHIGCAFSLHSIIISGLILWGQSSSKRQTVLWTKVTRILMSLIWPRRGLYLQKSMERHQDAVYLVDINLVVKKGLTFYKIRFNVIIFQETFPDYCIPKVVRMEIGEKSFLRKSVHVTSASTKDLFDTRMERGLGFRPRFTIISWAAIQKFPIEPTNSKSNSWENGETRCHVWRDHCAKWLKIVPFSGDRFQFFSRRTRFFRARAERPVIETSVIQARSSQDSQDPNVEQAHERTRRLVSVTNTEDVPDSSQTRSCHESETFNVGDETLRERTGKSVVDHDLSHEKIMVYEADMDFRIPGPRHSVVKHAAFENWFRKLRTTQIDTFFTRSTTKSSKKPCSPDGTDNAVHSMPIILEHRHRLLHVRAFLAERNSGQSKIRWIYDGFSFIPRVCHQERKTSLTQIWEKR